MRRDWKGSLSIEQCSLTAHSEGKELLWQVLQAVRAVDESGAWITSCQMLKSCQLKVCEEEGGQLLNSRKKRGNFKDFVDAGKSSMFSMVFTQIDTENVTWNSFSVEMQYLKSTERVKKRSYVGTNNIHFECIQCQVIAKPNILWDYSQIFNCCTLISWSVYNKRSYEAKRWLRMAAVFGNIYQSEETLTLDKTWERWCPSSPISFLIYNWGIVRYLSGSFLHP